MCGWQSRPPSFPCVSACTGAAARIASSLCTCTHDMRYAVFSVPWKRNARIGYYMSCPMNMLHAQVAITFAIMRCTGALRSSHYCQV